MIISHSRKFIFIHIHKAGGTSIEQALDPHLAWNDLILGGSPFGEKIQVPYAKRFGLNKHSSVTDIEEICGGRYIEEYFVFGLVRHPLDRLCSIYNFIGTALTAWAVRQGIALEDVAQHVTPQAAKKTPALTWLSSRIFLKTKNFSHFIRHKDIRTAPGLRSQVSVLSRQTDGKIAGEVFRLEDCPQWEARLSERLGFDFRLPHANPSGIRLIEPSAISTEDRAFIEKMFSPDYEAFGYQSGH